MEPVRVGVFASGAYLGGVARNNRGDFIVANEAGVISPEDSAKQQRATLYTSFYHAAMSQHIPSETILKLLRVHSYDVDFKQKVKPGDGFDVFFDVPDIADDRDSIGEVLYTSMTVDGMTRSFYRFRTPDGLVDYYDPEGNSAKKFLMRNPVKGGRYTSGFGMRRHPLLGINRMHTGVDWAAPSGTPILAAGDGTIEIAERHGGYGNYVRIRHANGFATAYGHMTRFAPGSKPGAHVKQGQIIGFVGSTGRSTGPHLHYEVLRRGAQINPLSVKLPTGIKLDDSERTAFLAERKRLLSLYAELPDTREVAARER
jgi:murein DD-endopeptidase MepM/ murein hydrolase activator NlpD